MNLSEDQKTAVTGWVKEGFSLSDVQKQLESEFSIRMTYMDVRFLVDDLNLEIQASGPEFNDLKTEVSAGPKPGEVAVSIDKVKRPDVLLSGQVTFSDGVNAEWSVDQMGRLGLKPSQQGYEPSEEDVQKFQAELQKLAEAQKGML